MFLLCSLNKCRLSHLAIASFLLLLPVSVAHIVMRKRKHKTKHAIEMNGKVCLDVYQNDRWKTEQRQANLCGTFVKKIWMNYVKMRGISIDGTRPNLNIGAHYLQMDRTNAFERAKEAARWRRWRVIYIRLSLTIDRRRCLHLCHQNNLQFFNMNWSIHCLSNQVTSYLSFTCNACIWFVRQKFNVPPHSTHSKLRSSRIQIDYLFSLF